MKRKSQLPAWMSAAVTFLSDTTRPRQKPDTAQWAEYVKQRAEQVRKLGGKFPSK